LSDIAPTFGNGRQNYEIGDLVVVVDGMAKNMTSELTGKPYETGDLSKEIDKRVKNAMADFCGKDTYSFGDVSKEVDRRVKNRVAEYLGKDEYEFGDITRQVETQRREWVKSYLGEEAAKNYKVSSRLRRSDFSGRKCICTNTNLWQFRQTYPCVITKVWRYHKEGHCQLDRKGYLSGTNGKREMVTAVICCLKCILLLLFVLVVKFGDITKKLMGNIFSKKND
jgi:hypothetical protein